MIQTESKSYVQYLLSSISLATEYLAFLIMAAIEVAPQPLPTSKTDFPLTTSGFSKTYLENTVSIIKVLQYQSVV